MDEKLLRVDGKVAHTLDFSFEDLKAFPQVDQVPEVSHFHPMRKGGGVTLNSILQRVDPKASASYLTLHATADDFAASVPLDAVRDEGIVLYHIDGEPMPLAQGGPIRFLIRNPAACHTAELDDCANVKFVDRMELSAGKGRDTRPTDDEEHEQLHRDPL